ncbi:hypothetical protein ACQP1P_11860 [Dactylosporangium sp. CA-052675]|uniref:hypothetical protein n=1 Tax=Dactylosporangium sp. CA-052675 TaxID=3239927 RepID=UPI003D8E9F6E
MSEDRFVTPAEWRRHLLPRRGGMPVPHVPEPGAAAVVPGATQGRPGIRESLTHAGTPPDIAAAGFAQLDGEPASTPLGAAAVAVFTRRRGLPFGSLDAVTAAEILRDLREVTQ